MTAIIVVSQRDRIHVATDAAIYRRAEGVVAFGNKVTAIAHLNGLVTCAGTAAAAPLFGWDFSHRYTDWDSMIERLPSDLPEMAASYGLPHGAIVLLAGISPTRGPEAWNFCLDDAVPPANTREEMEASPYHGRPFSLVKLPAHVETPVPPPDMAIAANWEGFDPEADEATTIWSMRKLLTMQRHMPLPEGVGGIGGFAEITTVSEAGITQRIVERWSDRLGAPLRPGAIDWKAWHADNPKPSATNRKPNLRSIRGG